MSYNNGSYVAASSLSGSFASRAWRLIPCSPSGKRIRCCKRRTRERIVVIGVLVTTTGIVLLVLGLVGASIEVYGQLLTAIVQQQLFAISEQLPAMLRPEVEQPSPGESGPPFSSSYILQKLVENLIGTPLWSALAVAGIVLIYSGLYLAQRQAPGRRARGR